MKQWWVVEEGWSWGRCCVSPIAQQTLFPAHVHSIGEGSHFGGSTRDLTNLDPFQWTSKGGAPKVLAMA